MIRKLLTLIFVLIIIKILFPALFLLIAAVAMIIGLMALMGGR